MAPARASASDLSLDLSVPTRSPRLGPMRAALMGAPSLVALSILMALPGTAHAQAVNLGGGNNIIADGRTQTNVTVSGNTTAITTNTVSQGTGFNSFTDFQQAAGTRVDLYVPDGAGNLVNIVRNGPVVIDGVLNSYKDGSIGGNVFFSSPNGFIVGQNGVVNVGSLTANTPTTEFLEGVIGPGGIVNDAMANRLMRGEIPVSPDGIIAIAGTINADGGVTLQGRSVSVTGQINSRGVEFDQRTLFESSVNTNGLIEGGAMVVRGGVVSIVATGDVHLAGTIDVSAGRNGTTQGGAIAVRTGGNIAIEGVTRLRADGAGVEGGGGLIEIVAGDTLTVRDQALLTARGTGTASGGFVELSGETVRVAGVDVDLGSERGRGGTLLFDPVDLYIGVPGSSVALGPNDSVVGNYVNANSIRFQADNSITVLSNGIIDTTRSGGQSGDITLEAPFITIADNAVLRADAVGGGTAGNITLDARNATGGLTGFLVGGTTRSAITVGNGAILSGGNISLLSSAEAGAGILPVSVLTAHSSITVRSATITASGTFSALSSASASASTASNSFIPSPLGIVVADVSSAVRIGDSAAITAGTVELSATSSVNVDITTRSVVPGSSPADGAIAVAEVESAAEVAIGGGGRITAGDLSAEASNDITVGASATPRAATFGASVAVSVVEARTAATIADTAFVRASSLSLTANSTTDIAVTAKAASGGGSESAPPAGSRTATYLDRYGKHASTGDQSGSGQGSTSVSVVGGLAVSDLTSTTIASIGANTDVAVTGATAVSALGTSSATLVADGSAVEAKTGVGAAVGINLAKVSSTALVERLTTGTLDIVAGTSSGAQNVFSTTATSGAGSSNVGIAGSFAVNLLDTESAARIGANGAVSLTGPDRAISLDANNVTSSTASAKPTGVAGGSGAKFGLGGSVALNLLANRSLAELGQNATLTNAGALSLNASGVFTTLTEAEAGSAGGISLTPALALSMVSNTTAARLASGTSVLSAGAVTLGAAQRASTTTTASGEAAGGKAAVGAALALALVDDISEAIVARGLNSSAAVTLSASGLSASSLSANASASGGEEDTAQGGQGSSGGGQGGVDRRVTSQLTAAQGTRNQAGVGSASQRSTTNSGVSNGQARSASTSEGGVSVAAAVGVNVQNAHVTAEIADGVAVTAAGALTLSSIANTEASVVADGSAVGADGTQQAKIGVGAAVSVNVVSSLNRARLGNGAHTLGGLEISALRTDIADPAAGPRADVYLTHATSGAGASSVGIAGSLALNLIDTESSARIAANASVSLSAGSVSLEADNRSTTTSSALPEKTGVTGGKFGLGASAAITILANRAIAELDDGATISGADDVTLSANGVFSATTRAEAGSAGGISVTPALGLSLVSNSTAARLGTGATLNAGGLVGLTATQVSTTTTSASATASGNRASIGASAAIALVDDEVLATTARNVTAGGNVAFSASGHSSGTLSAKAGAAGARGEGQSGQGEDGKTVDQRATSQLGFGAGRQSSANVGSTRQRSATNAGVANESGRSAQTQEGKLSVAAAVAINASGLSVTALVPATTVITAGGNLTVASQATLSGTVTADASATGSQVGIGAAGAVNALTKTNSAQLLGTGHSANGIIVTALQFGTPGSEGVDTISVTASSGAGGSKIGLAGALALNVVSTDVVARLSGSAAAGTGASRIAADTRSSVSAIARPAAVGASGATAGIGASVGLNVVKAIALAELADGATLSGGRGLAVSANSALSTTSRASAGATGGVAIDAVVALTLMDQQTRAQIGTGTGLSMGTDAVSITASSSGAHIAEAIGKTKGGKVSIGAAVAAILGTGAATGSQSLQDTSVTSASLARNVTAGSLAVTASSARSYLAEAEATAGGARTAQNNSDAPPAGQASSTNTLQKTQGSQRGGQGGGKVTVAAAIGVAATQDTVSAGFANGLFVSTSGDVSVGATNATSVVTFGSGAAVDPKTSVGVGVGVGLSIINNTTTASVGAAGTINAGSGAVTVSAVSSENATEQRVAAGALAGAAARTVSVAGAFAVAISTSETRATIGDGSTVSTTGALAVRVDNTSQLSAKALAGAFSGGQAGIGASVATAYSERTLDAAIGAGVTVSAGSVAVRAINHEIDVPPAGLSIDFDNLDPDSLKTQFATAVDDLTQKPLFGRTNYYAEAVGGAAAPSGVAVQGSFAVLVFDDAVTASIGRSVSGSSTAITNVTATGAVTLEARNDLVSRAVSGGVAIGSNAGVGVSSSVIASEGTTRAILAGNARVLQSGSFANTASASQDVWAFGLAAGVASTAGVAGVATVIVSENTVEAINEGGSQLRSAGTATVSASNGFVTRSVATGIGAGGKAGVGGAASIVTVENVTRAVLGTNAALHAGAKTTISASSGVDALTLAAAGAAGGAAGVAAGAAVYVLDARTEALVGTGAQVGQGPGTPGALEVSARDDNRLITVSGALGGGGKAGVGAGGAVGVVTNQVSATIGQNARVAVSDLTLSAEAVLKAHTVSIAGGVGGVAGLAGAASAFSVNNTISATIASNADIVARGNAAILADEEVDVAFIAGAMAGSGTASVGASASIAVVKSTTRAEIAASARVSALGLGNDLTYRTGTTPGLALHPVLAKAIAAPMPSDFTIDMGSDGEVRTATEARRQGLRLLLLDRTATPTTATARGVVVNAAGSAAVRSLAVGGAASAGASVSVSANIPLITTTVEARIGQGAQINTAAGAGADQSVVVAAASDIYRIGIAGSVAGGTVGVGGGVETTIVKPTTRALIDTNASVSARRDVIVSADARQDLVGAAAAASVGVGAALAGGVAVVHLDSTTEARIGAGATVRAGGNAVVSAEDHTRTAMVAGSVALDFGGGGMAGSIAVTALNKRTSATIGDGADVSALGNHGTRQTFAGSNLTDTRSSRGVIVSANATESLFSLGISGSGGAFLAFAGAVSIQLVDSATSATIGGNARINQVDQANANSGQDVVVVARNSTSVAAIDGGVAVSLGAGIAGAVDIGILRNTTSASIGNGALVSARDRVDVAGIQNVDVSSFALSAAGGIVGVAAGVSVYSIGNGISLSGEETSDTRSTIAGTGSYVQGQLGNGTVGSIFGGSDDARVRAISSEVQGARAGLDVNAKLSATPLATPAGTSATVGSATITAGGAVGVVTHDTVNTQTVTGAVAGGLVGLGAGVGVVTVSASNTAQVNQGATINAGSFGLDARSLHALRAGSAAGSIGYTIAAQAAVAILSDRSSVTARVTGATIATRGAVSVKAFGSRTGDAQALGAAIGGTGAIGASIAMVNLGGSVSAEITGGSSVGSAGAEAASVTLEAVAENLAVAETGAASGGIGIAAAGSIAIADASTSVSTTLSNTTINALGAVSAAGIARSRALADARGIALSGLFSVGGSIANASVANTVATRIAAASVSAGSVTYGSAIELLGSRAANAPIVALPGSRRGDFHESATAYASGSAGALVGVAATRASATNASSSKVDMVGGSILSNGAVSVSATSRTIQNATVSGLAVGIVAAGSNEARANSGATTEATLSDATVTAASLTVNATGVDGNFANAVSGSGGLIAGAAASAETRSTSTTRARVLASAANASTISTLAGTTKIAATHTALFGGAVNSRQASVAGGSSANIDHRVTSTVAADLGANVRLFATNLDIAALNRTHNFFIGGPAFDLSGGTAKSGFNSDGAGWNVDSGSGGLINVPAGSSAVRVNHTTTATVGENARVHLLAPVNGVSRFALEAYNEAIVQQRARLDSGGAIALADVAADITVTAGATATIADGAEVLVDRGDIAVAAWGQADLEGRAVASTYGLAGAPRGRAHVTYNGTNAAIVGTNARVEATDGITTFDGRRPTNGTVSINAGASLVGRQADLAMRATVDLFNNTAIPIDGRPDARVATNNQSSLLIRESAATHPVPGAAYGVLAAGDISLRSMRGNVTASAVGIGKNIYLEVLSETASAISEFFGGGEVTFEVRAGSTSLNTLGVATVNGRVATGLQRHKQLTITYASQNTAPNAYLSTNCDVTAAFCLVAPNPGDMPAIIGPEVAVGLTLLERLAELRTLLAQYNSDPVAKGAYQNEIRFLERKLASLGLGSFDAAGNFEPGQYVGPSPRARLEAEANSIRSTLEQLKTQFGIDTVVVSEAADDWAAVMVSLFGADALSFTTNVNNAVGELRTFSNFADFTRVPTTDNPNSRYNAAIAQKLGEVATKLGTASAAGTQVQTLSGQLVAKQTSITTLAGEIGTLQTQLGEALRTGSSSAAGLQTQIATKQGQINTALSEISTLNGQIATQAEIVRADTSSIVTLLGEVQTALSPTAADAVRVINLGRTTSDNTRPEDNGFLVRLRLATTGVSFSYDDNGTVVTVTTPGTNSIASATAAYRDLVAPRITTLTGTGTGSTSSEVTRLSTLTSDLVAKVNAAAAASNSSGSPTTRIIEVADVAARLGNISIEADRLVGTGALSAPGDAKITVVNNTANSLRLGNMLIPDYDAGRVRFNGVVVLNNDQINALNPSGTSAGFSQILTAATSSRPQISITSTYNPESRTSHDPASPLFHLKTPQVAPDIIIKRGSLVSNLEGSVEITSAAGNIYNFGEIQAGSVSILARNGDFVSSYVNGFNHIGGDPSRFVTPTDQNEAGRGIIANGAISISARYLNINSTIQSGIAQWSLALTNSTLLSTLLPTDIGLTASAVETARSGYLTKLRNGTATSADQVIQFTRADGHVVTLNMAPESGVSFSDLRAFVNDYESKIAGAGEQGPDPIYWATVNGKQVSINIRDYLSGNIVGRLEFSIAAADAHAAVAGSGNTNYQVISAANSIGAAYDARNKQFVVDGTTVRGGYVQLYGQIMNTSGTAGKIRVLDGFGTINVTNTSAIPVILQTLNAGFDEAGNGRGTQGVIEITDIRGINTSNPASPRVDVTLTRYTRDYVAGSASGRVGFWSHQGYLDGTTGEVRSNGVVDGIANKVITFADLERISSRQTTGTTDRGATYNPTANQRYVWTTGNYFERTTDFSVKQTQLFGSSTLTISERTQLDNVNGRQIDSYQLANGTYVTVDSTRTGTATQVQTNQGIVIANNPQTTSNGALSGTAYTVSTDGYITEQNGPRETGRRRDCNWWTICIASKVTINYTVNQKYTVIETESIRADHPIGIEFIGTNAAQVGVNSASNIVLTGNVTANAGTVTLNSSNGSIVQGTTSALITANTVNLTGNSVGGVTYSVEPSAPINGAVAVRTGDTGVLNATARDGMVSVHGRGDLRVGTVTAAGDVRQANTGVVNLIADRSIVGLGSGTLIQAPRVVLTALGGSIGGMGNTTLTVKTGFSTDQTLRPFGTLASQPSLRPYLGLSATAARDIDITAGTWAGVNEAGHMLVDRVVSLGGDVRLSAPGFVLDNNPFEAIDTRTYAQLLDYWDALGLVGGAANTARQAEMRAAFENARSQGYHQYWQLRGTQADGGATYDANFRVTVGVGTPRYVALVDQFTATLRAADPTIGDQALATGVALKIAEFETAQTDLYRQLNGQVGALTTSYDAQYRYVASADEVASLTRGSTWTEGQLAFSISPGALKTVTSTNPVIKDPNVSGRTVSITAGLGVGETVGAGTSAVGITIAGNTQPDALTDAQKIALASAERSDLQLTVRALVLPANATQAQIEAYNAAIAAGVGTGAVDIALGLSPDQMSATQRAALRAASLGLADRSDMSLTVLAKRPVTFEAIDRLDVGVTSPTAPGVIDQGTAHLASRGDGALGTISVAGETRIRVLGSLFNALSGVPGTISIGNLVLEAAQGGIGTGINPRTGTAYAPLVLNPRTGATLTARAQGGVNLAVTGDALVDTIYSPQNVTVTATGSILNANNDALINILGTVVKLDAKANGTIGSATRALNVGVNPTGSITAEARGLINLFGSAGNAFVVSKAVSDTGSIRLVAALEGIIDGDVTAPGRIDLGAGSRLVVSGRSAIASTTGLVTVDAGTLKMINGASLVATTGRVSVTTRGDALVTGIVAGGTDQGTARAVSVTAGGRVFGGTAAGRIDITALAAGASVAIDAATGIGDRTWANAGWGPAGVAGHADEIVTAVANPLRILTELVDLVADAGNIHAALLAPGVTVTALAETGDIDLTANGSVETTALVSRRGNVSLVAEGLIDATGLEAGTAAGATRGAISLVSRLGDIIVGTARSAGAQDYRAEGQLTLDDLVSTGVPGDRGSISGTARTGAIGVGSIDAAGAITLGAKTGIGFTTLQSGLSTMLDAGTTIVGARIASADGSIRATAGDGIGIVELEAGLVAGAREGAIALSSASGPISVGSAMSGGSQDYRSEGDFTFGTLRTLGLPGDVGNVAGLARTGAVLGGDVFANGSIDLRGNGIVFGTLLSGGDSTLVSGRGITGDKQIAGGTVTDIAEGDIRLNLIKAPRITIDTMGEFSLPDMRVAESAVLRAGRMLVGITHEPAGPGRLSLTLTGGRGTVGAFASLSIDAPQGIHMPQFRFFEAGITTTARAVTIADAYVPGRLRLETPEQTLLVENRSPTPQAGNNVQMFDPDFGFGLDLDGVRLFTNSFVVKYDVTSQETNVLTGLGFDGASLVRDSIRIMHRPGTGSALIIVNAFEETDIDNADFDEAVRVVVDGMPYPVFTLQDGPAVQLSQLN